MRVTKSPFGFAYAFGFVGGALFIGLQDAMRGEAFHGKGSADADAFIVFVRLVEEEFGVGAAGDGSVDFFLAGEAEFPPVGVECEGGGWPFGVGLARDFPLLPVFFEGGV